MPSGCETADGTVSQAAGMGSMTFVTKDSDNLVTLSGILHVPAFCHNLVSMRQLKSKGCTIVSKNGHSAVYDNDNRLLFSATWDSHKDGYVINWTHVKQEGREGPVDLLNAPFESAFSVRSVNAQAHASSTITPKNVAEEALLWHRRLGHIGQTSIKKAWESSTGIPKRVADVKEPSLCHPCCMNLQNRDSFGHDDRRATRPLELVHFDMSGPHIPGVDGQRYFALFVDDYSRRVWTFFTAKRSAEDIKAIIQEFLNEAHSETHHRVTRMHSDGEFKHAVYMNFLSEKGIHQTFTEPYTPQHNARAERVMRTIKGPARTMIAAAKLPVAYWPFAVQHAGWIRNRVGHRSLNNVSPWERWTGEKPDLSRARVFGCIAFPMLQEGQREPGSWAPRARAGVYLGESRISGCHIFWIPDAAKNPVNAREAKFDEGRVWVWKGSEEARLAQLAEFDEEWYPPMLKPSFDTTPPMETQVPNPSYEAPLGMPYDPTPTDEDDLHPQARPGSPLQPPTQVQSQTSVPMVVENVSPRVNLTDTQSTTPTVSSSVGTGVPQDTIPQDSIPRDIEQEDPVTPPREATPGPLEPPQAPQKPRYGEAVPRRGIPRELKNLLTGAGWNLDGKRSDTGQAKLVGHPSEIREALRYLEDTRNELYRCAKAYPDSEEAQAHQQELMLRSVAMEVFQEELTPAETTKILSSRANEYVNTKISVNGQPVGEAEAARHPDWPHWLEAMKIEMDSLWTMGTFKVVDLPKGANLVGCKWVLVLKRDKEGNPIKWKARLVAQGFTQEYSVDYEETFSPVVRLDALRAILSFAVDQGHCIKLMDVASAYLNGKNQYPIYMKQPSGFHVGEKHQVLLLLRALYGLKASGREWYLNLKQTLCEAQFEQADADPCVFTHQRGVTLVIYVDDLFVVSYDMPTQEWAINLLMSKYSMTVSTTNSAFIGVAMDPHMDGGFRLHQEFYIASVLGKFGCLGSQMSTSPMATGVTLTKWDGVATDGAKHSFLVMIGSFLWIAMVTRPDIAFVVCTLARFSSNPSPDHFKAAYHLGRYLNKTIHLGLDFMQKVDGPRGVLVFSDANFAADLDQRRSTSGWVITVNGRAVSWGSKLQPIVAHSTLDAEFIALSFASTHGIIINNLLIQAFKYFTGEDGIQPTYHVQPEPLPVLCDNTAAVKNAHEDLVASKIKHIDIKYKIVKDYQRRKVVNVMLINTTQNAADVLTKPLFGQALDEARRKLGLVGEPLEKRVDTSKSFRIVYY